MAGDLHARIWEWLPARANRGRVTQPGAIAVALGVPTAAVVSALVEMEAAGHVIRDRVTGRRASSWHRGMPIPGSRDGGGQGELF